jgi:hypothetical protein
MMSKAIPASTGTLRGLRVSYALLVLELDGECLLNPPIALDGAAVSRVGAWGARQKRGGITASTVRGSAQSVHANTNITQL